MKIRVEQIGELYYPQYRRMCAWKNYVKPVGHDTYEVVVFNTLDQVIDYAKSYDTKVYEID